MPSLIRFVDSITTNPMVLLDLNVAPLMVDKEGMDFSPPDVRRSTVETFLGVDGDTVVDFAPQNRLIKMKIDVVRTASAEQAAEAVSDLHYQLARERNFLMVQLDGMTKPVFFRTYAAHDYTMDMLRLWLASGKTQLDLEIPAEPYGYGPKVTLSSRTIYNANSMGAAAAINGDFETDVSGWQIETGGSTLTRSTAQFHAGAASALITPNGSSATVRAVLTANVAANPGERWHARAWLRCAVSRTINLECVWYNGASVISRVSRTVSVSANAWNHFDTIIATAPASTTGVRVAVMEDSTPAASNLLYFDQVQLIKGEVDGSMFTDVTGVQGDTDTPLFLSVADSFSTSATGRKVSLLAMRKGGTPANVPFNMDASTFSLGTNASVVNDLTGEATNGQYATVSFGTATMQRRLYVNSWPPVWTTDLRGRYDIYARVRGSSSNTYQMQLGWGNASINVYKGDVVTLPSCPTNVWFYVWLGTLSFPSGFDPVTDGYSGVGVDAGQIYIEIDAARTAGASNLDIDVINLVPADDETCLVKWPDQTNATNYVLDGRATAVYGLDASGRAVAVDPIAVAGAVPLLRPGVTNRIFWMRDVGYGTGSTQALGTGDHQSETTVITPYYWPRYWMLRQATT